MNKTEMKWIKLEWNEMKLNWSEMKWSLSFQIYKSKSYKFEQLKITLFEFFLKSKDKNKISLFLILTYRINILNYLAKQLFQSSKLVSNHFCCRSYYWIL